MSGHLKVSIRRSWLLAALTGAAMAALILGFWTAPGAKSSPGPGTLTAYVVNEFSNDVSVLHLSKEFGATEISRIPVGARPIGIVATPDGQKVYVGNSDSKSVSVIDTASNTVIKTISLGSPMGALAISPDGSSVFVGKSEGRKINEIDTATDERVIFPPTGKFGFPQAFHGPAAGLAVSQDGQFLFATSSWSPESGVSKISLTGLPAGNLNPTDYSFEPNQGLSLSNALTNNAEYSIEIIFNFSNVNGFRKIIDFQRLISDCGLYNLSTKLNFFCGNTGPSGAFTASVDAHVVLTRDGATKEVNGYVDGILQFSFIDTGGDAIFTANTIRFFEDDIDTDQDEASAGVVDRIRIYDGVLAEGQVLDIFNGAAPPSSVTHIYELNGSFTDDLGGPRLGDADGKQIVATQSGYPIANNGPIWLTLSNNDQHGHNDGHLLVGMCGSAFDFNKDVCDGEGPVPFVELHTSDLSVSRTLFHDNFGALNGIEVTTDGSRAYVVDSSHGDKLHIVNLDDFSYTGFVQMNSHPRAVTKAVFDDGSEFLYVPDSEHNWLAKIDARPSSGDYNTVVDTTDVGTYPRSVAIANVHRPEAHIISVDDATWLAEMEVFDDEGHPLSGSVNVFRESNPFPEGISEIRLEILQTECGQSNLMHFFYGNMVEGVLIEEFQQNQIPSRCTSNPGITTHTYTDSAILDLYDTADGAVNQYHVGRDVSPGRGVRTSWARLVVSGPGADTRTYCMFDIDGGDCTATNPFTARFTRNTFHVDAFVDDEPVLVASVPYSNSELPDFIDLSGIDPGILTLELTATDTEGRSTRDVFENIVFDGSCDVLIINLSIEKELRFTNVNFAPTDADGNPLPAELGTLLDIAHDDHSDVTVNVHPKKGTVQSTNPGQLYSVVSISATHLESFWFHEEFGRQFDVNPAQLGGGIAVIVVDADGFATDLTGILKNVLEVEVTVDNDANTIWLDVPIVDALGRAPGPGETLMIYVKFEPSQDFKGQSAPGFPDHWENGAFVDLNHDGTPDLADHASIHLDKKEKKKK